MSNATIQELRRQLTPDGGKVHNAAFKFLHGNDPERPRDPLLDRAFAILHRLATENTGWRSLFRRWYYSDEPLRNDAANLVRAAGFEMVQPKNTRLVGER